MKFFWILISGLVMAAAIGHAQITTPGWYNGFDSSSISFTPPDISSNGPPQPAAQLQGTPGIAQNTTNIADVVTPEIQALANGLQNDPVKIYNYVHDHIKYVLYFGSKKGAQLTLLEKSGNDFDQSALLVALLKAAGFSPNYQFGWQEVPYNAVNGTHNDLRHWLQLTVNNTNWNVTSNYLLNLFIGIRGYPTMDFMSIHQPDTNNILFQRVWVRLPIGSAVYILDPAFKVSEYTNGISLSSAVGINSNNLISVSGGTDTGNYVTNLNEANLRGTLSNYTTNLLNFLQQNNPNASVQQVLGGWQVTPSTVTYLTNLYAFPVQYYSTMGLSNWYSIPTNLMASLTITFAATNYHWFMPQLQGQRLSLTLASNGLAQLWQDDAMLAQNTTTGSSRTNSVVLNFVQPFGSWDYINNVLIPASFGNLVVTNTYQRTNAIYALTYAFEPDWGWLQERQNQLNNYIAQGLPSTSRQVVSETLNVMALSWMLQTEYAGHLMEPQLGILPQSHLRLGRMGQEGGNGYYIDAYMELYGFLSNAGFDTANNNRGNQYFDLHGYFESALEHGIIEQMQNSNIVGASTVKMLEIANTNGQAVFLASSTNWTTGANVSGKLVNYSSADKTAIGNLTSQGYYVLLPQNGTNHVAGAGTWAGYGYINHFVTNGTIVAGFTVGGGYNGGYDSTPGATANTSTVQTTGNNQPASNGQTPALTPNPTSADPVDTADDTFQVEHTDLSLGQSEPRGISLSRYYNGTRRNDTQAGLAGGWIHNYVITANNVAVPQAGLGGTTPAQAAAMIAATASAIAIYNGNAPDPKNWLATALISKWGVDQLTKNGVSVNLGKDSLQFVQQPNGVFTPPANSTATLTQTNSAYSLLMRHGNRFNFNAAGYLTNIVDQYGKALTLTYNASNLVNTITDWTNRQFTFSYSGSPSQLASISDGTRTVSYGYSTAYNSGGDLTSFTDPEGKTTSYIYDTNHQIIATVDALNRMVVSNAYDSQGHITIQCSQGDTNKAWQVYWSGWETAEFDPAGGEQQYFYDDEGRLTGTQDPLGNLSQMVYDGQNHITQTVSPLGETNLAAYDGNNNLVQQIDALGKTNQFIFDGNNNLISSIDPLGNATTYGYNAQFSLIGQTNGAGDFVNYAFNGDGTLQTRTDIAGTTTYGYDSYGQLSTITYPNGLGVETFANSYFGDVTNHTDGRGIATSFQYNERRQLTNNIAIGM